MKEKKETGGLEPDIIQPGDQTLDANNLIIALATSFKSIVLPVFGCATIIPLWPFPIGENKSMILVDRDSLLWPVRVNFSDGKRGVKY